MCDKRMVGIVGEGKDGGITGLLETGIGFGREKGKGIG